MKKFIKALLSVGFLAVLFAGCAASSPEGADVKMADYSFFKDELPLKKVRTIILDAGRKAQWRMTEFKDNEVVAEKSEGDQTISASIMFTRHAFNVEPENDELRELLEEALNQE